MADQSVRTNVAGEAAGAGAGAGEKSGGGGGGAPPKITKKKKKQKKCFACGRYGHIRAACPMAADVFRRLAETIIAAGFGGVLGGGSAGGSGRRGGGNGPSNEDTDMKDQK